MRAANIYIQIAWIVFLLTMLCHHPVVTTSAQAQDLLDWEEFAKESCGDILEKRKSGEELSDSEKQMSSFCTDPPNEGPITFPDPCPDPGKQPCALAEDYRPLFGNPDLFIYQDPEVKG